VLVDGTDDEATVVSPSPGESKSAGSPAPASEAAPAYRPPGSYVQPSSYSGQSERRTWPWILGIVALLLLLFAGLGIAAAFLIPQIVNTTANKNISPSNANVERRNNNSNPSLSNSNPNEGNANNNDTSNAEDSTPAPTDEGEVLADLTDLEHDWTVANINADKAKLDRILADDYAGTTIDGKPQGKADYLRTIQRDTTTQKWNFEDLKASLKGDRASLTGTIRLVINDQQGQPQNVAYRFTDKFVWRDGRWQATGSEVTPLNRVQ
jgi:ketosteroid isomerase-like protein